MHELSHYKLSVEDICEFQPSLNAKWNFLLSKCNIFLILNQHPQGPDSFRVWVCFVNLHYLCNNYHKNTLLSIHFEELHILVHNVSQNHTSITWNVPDRIETCPSELLYANDSCLLMWMYLPHGIKAYISDWLSFRVDIKQVG